MAETVLEVDSVDTALAIFGNCDENIRLLEQAFGVTAICRGTEVKLTGGEEDVERARRALDAMLMLRAGGTPLEEQTVRYCISLAGSGDEARVKDLTGDFIAITAKGRPVRPKTLGQKAYIGAIVKNAVTFGVGPAGTGKTYLAVAMAVKAFKAREVSRIILTRPAVEAGEKLGFLPGDLQNKVDPYLRPLYDALFDMLGADAFIILDEAQNTSPEQMKMFLTRMGAGSKVVVTGDITQIDLPDKARSGLVDALGVLKNVEGIAMIHFSEKDVVRHRLVQEIIRAYDKAQAARNRK